MEKRFDGKVVMVTGGTGGIGTEIYLQFLDQGALVICVDRRSPEYRLNSHSKFMWNRADVSESRDVEVLVARVIREFGRIDILVNSHGVQPEESAVEAHELSEDVWDAVLDINLKGAWLMAKYVIPFMRKHGGGRIININSVTAEHATRYMAAYSASKAGLRMLTRVLALENARYGILINDVSPGSVDSSLLRATVMRQSGAESVEEGIKEMAAAYPLGRIGYPKDIADAVLYLASDAAQFITGAELVVDGGVSVQGQWAMRPVAIHH